MTPLRLRCRVRASLAVLALALSAAGRPAASPPFPDALADLLDGVSARLERLQSPQAWTASVVSTTSETDDRWVPRKTTVVRKSVTVAAGLREEEILKAEETRDGVTRDVTARYAAEQKERRGLRPGRRFDLDQILPFARAKRDAFEFRLGAPEPGPAGPAIALEVRARRPDPRTWNGTYVVDPATFEILRARLAPSRNPRFVKEISVAAEPLVVDGRWLLVKSTRLQLNAGMFLKRIRMIVEDVYSDVQVKG